MAKKSSEEIGFVSYAQLVGEPITQGWVFSTGASVHVCNSRDKFVDYRPVTGKHVSQLDNSKVNVSGIGSVTLRFTSGQTVTLKDVVHIPSFINCFVSVGRFVEEGFAVSFDSGKAMIYKNKKFVGNGCMRPGGFLLNVDNDDHPAVAATST
ncbi:hypothetical protein Lser_V15G09140 [Lactuca serriola]